MPDIWLMRHGAYDGHRPGLHAPSDAPLTPEGRQHLISALPLPAGITGIITSPLPRARQTAEVLRDLTGLTLLDASDLLAEWRAPTCVLNRTPDTYPPAYRAWRTLRTTSPDLACEDGESLSALHSRATRCVAYLHDLAARQQGPLLAVSHKLLLGVLTHLPQGPAAFETASRTPWPFATTRPLHL
ncbi:histidine phosphatase family protein [Streptomyces sp. YIM 98790]|uniref:histidine phosphatase family protein n=1 Tax=Streptomyces sp. YIM 98790 TaxID=2689077 RepID=UPI0014090693|nr:histidine phosphatase family protein [Streptomyces sp. YIM 98790]